MGAGIELEAGRSGSGPGVVDVFADERFGVDVGFTTVVSEASCFREVKPTAEDADAVEVAVDELEVVEACD